MKSVYMQLVLLALAAAMFFGGDARAFVPNDIDTPQNRIGLDPQRAGQYGGVDHIDLYSGALSLMYTDFQIPGAYGLNLEVSRTYSSKVVDEYLSPVHDNWSGIGWFVIPGGRMMFDLGLDAAMGSTQYLRLQLPGYGETIAYQLDPKDTLYRTAAHAHAWPGMDPSYDEQYVTDDLVFVYRTAEDVGVGQYSGEFRAITPEGVVYVFDLDAGTHNDGWYYGVEIYNEHGDNIALVYDSCAWTTHGGALESMTDANSRSVTFTVDGSCHLDALSYTDSNGAGASIDYVVDASGYLTDVSRA